jgi:hypothetical protein
VCIDDRCVTQIEEGQRCKLDPQCPEGMVCDRDPMGEQRICLPKGDEEDPCWNTRQCAAPWVCVGATDDSPGECAPHPGGLGEPCANGAGAFYGNCAEGLWCSYGTDPEGQCELRVGEDGFCLSFGVPETQACIDELHCTEAGTCGPQGELGEPCNVFDQGSCGEGLWCSRETLTCEAPAEEDEPCNPFWSNACAEGFGCACGQADRDLCGTQDRQPSLTDLCKPLLEDGEACYRWDECESLECLFDFEADSSEPGECVSPAPVCLP